MNVSPLEVIEYIKSAELARGRPPISTDGEIGVYDQGECAALFLMLKKIFPQAQPFKVHTICGRSGLMIIKHILTEIDDVFYDINGVADVSLNKNGYTWNKPNSTNGKIYYVSNATNEIIGENLGNHTTNKNFRSGTPLDKDVGLIAREQDKKKDREMISNVTREFSRD